MVFFVGNNHCFREAFAGFDAEVVTKFSEKQMMSDSVTCGMDLSKVRGVVDNANRILEVTREFGSLDKYFWGFVNNKPITTNYKSTHKMPVKTSKSESISKDMMKRGFRSVGPTVIHSFTQAAGLTNDHLIFCQQHAKCAAMA
uniref:DNA-3-methyladenine glycosylase I n=1 Tax=Kalanchoe fedtschenkoi TaxID=63787 RepID=A0A7N0UGE6_KALFE